LHQRDEGRDDESDAIGYGSGELEAKRFSVSSWHYDRDISSIEGSLNSLTLVRAKGGVAKELSQGVQEFGGVLELEVDCFGHGRSGMLEGRRTALRLSRNSEIQ
jgi:hypothetical protein